MAGSINNPVLPKALAQKIIRDVQDTLPYNINIMNTEGYIIASTSAERVGTFHQIAYNIMTSQSETIETYNSRAFVGTRQGINMALKHGGQKIGVLGITGSPDEVRPFVRMLKLTVETIIDFEMDQQNYVLKYSQRQHLESGFLYGAVSDTNLHKWADEISLDTECTRVPVIIRTSDVLEFPRKMQLMKLLETVPEHSGRDFITQWPRKEFVVFKDVSSLLPGQAIESHRAYLEAYLRPFADKLRESGLSVHVTTGTFSNVLSEYHDAYNRAHWLLDMLPQEDDKQLHISFFYDYVSDWMRTFIPREELRQIYGYLERMEVPQKQIDQMLKIHKALESCNYNMSQASERLFIDKNTLSNWMENIRTLFGIDPIHDTADRSFWGYLCAYYQGK